MKNLTTILLLGLLGGTAAGADPAPLTFRDIEYLHRWSKDQQHEYTPRDQEDLEKWTDMITIVRHPDVTSGEALAAKANAVLETYKRNRAMVIRTESTPRSSDKPAEHLIVVLFPRLDFIEAVFARVRIIGGVGTSVTYSHREYGQKIGGRMSTWLRTNGPALEKILMAWEQMPPEPKRN